uniref:TLC domain-containing protein n=1 Tax=Tetraselmis chuii TaxID=63592 RepID=A0A7S1SLT9_9CHLO|mmetsp:Transcript_18912/g.33758  ORF Transcript_18912/g.33758 Transcript_18912/m.33758 type:complete len:265 (+) Transcript_18912:276-1070(+)
MPKPVVQHVVCTAAFMGLHIVLDAPVFRRAISGWFRRNRLRNKGEEPTKEQTKKFTAKTIIKLVNEVHNLVNVPLGMHVIGRPEMRQDKLYATCRSSMALNLIGAGFFTQDLIMVCKKFNPEMFLHAGVCCPIYVYSFFSKHAQYYSSAFMMWEASTPFVHAREIMHDIGMGKSKAYAANGLTMMAVFFLCRNLYGTFLLVDFWKGSRQEILRPTPQPAGGKCLSTKTIWVIRTGGILMTALNTLWFSKMAQGAAKLFLKKKPA